MLEIQTYMPSAVFDVSIVLYLASRLQNKRKICGSENKKQRDKQKEAKKTKKRQNKTEKKERVVRDAFKQARPKVMQTKGEFGEEDHQVDMPPCFVTIYRLYVYRYEIILPFPPTLHTPATAILLSRHPSPSLSISISPASYPFCTFYSPVPYRTLPSRPTAVEPTRHFPPFLSLSHKILFTFFTLCSPTPCPPSLSRSLFTFRPPSALLPSAQPKFTRVLDREVIGQPVSQQIMVNDLVVLYPLLHFTVSLLLYKRREREARQKRSMCTFPSVRTRSSIGIQAHYGPQHFV
jgi:hypothetical protein